jgi:hypothetical protein
MVFNDLKFFLAKSEHLCIRIVPGMFEHASGNAVNAAASAVRIKKRQLFYEYIVHSPQVWTTLFVLERSHFLSAFVLG